MNRILVGKGELPIYVRAEFGNRHVTVGARSAGRSCAGCWADSADRAAGSCEVRYSGRVRLSLPLSIVLLFLVSGARADAGGVWSGTLTAGERCNAIPVAWSSQFKLAIVPVAGEETVRGNAFFAAVPIFDERCAIAGTFAIAVPFGGRVSGGTLTGALVFRGRPVEMSATISGSSMELSLRSPDFNATAPLTQSTTEVPHSFLSGFYSGTYSVRRNVDRCRNLAEIAYSGPLDGTVVQTGMFITATGTLSGVKRLVRDAGNTCSLQADEESLFQMSGQISGSTITGVIFDPTGEEKALVPFTATVSSGTISGRAADEEGELSFTMTRSMAAAPRFVALTANPATIAVGEAGIVSWQTENAGSVTIDHAIGRRPANGQIVVRPRTTTTFTVTAWGPGGSVQAPVTVTVTPRPRVVVSSFPRGFIQPPGEGGGTDRFTLSNVGEAPTTVTLTAGTFFTLDPASFPLAAGENRTVMISGLPQPAGPYVGVASVAGEGVLARGIPVRMLSATPPAGIVRARAPQARAEISSGAGQSATGSVTFTNDGSEVLQGVAVSDVSWIEPQSGIVTIPPGGTAAVSFTVDPSRRPDSEAPQGAVTGSLSLLFPGGQAQGLRAAQTSAGGSTVSVTLVYMVKPSVTPGLPPALSVGELARFAPGIPNRSRATGDLLLGSNLTNATLAAIQLYLLGGGTSQSATIAQLQPNSVVALPGVVGSVFGSGVQSASVQVRGEDVSKLAIAAVVTNTTSAEGTFSTALPLFRSDRSAGSNAAIILSGVEQTGNASADLFVQETSGNAASFGIDFLDASGSVIAARASEAIAAFGFAELPGLVPPGTAAVRLVNTSTSGTLAAYALMSNDATGDGWAITDPAAGSGTDETFVIPILPAGPAASSVLYTTNRSDEPVEMTVEVAGGRSARRRLVGHGSTTTPPQLVHAAIALGPGQTTATDISATSGWIRLVAPAASVSAAARSIVSSGSASYGSGWPVIPASEALRAGGLRRFAGVHDAAAGSGEAATPGTFRTNLLLVETEGQSGVVRVTLQFTFSGGSLASSSARVSRDYAIAASQALMIPDLARSVAGAMRDSFGDLRDMIVDVEIVSGSSRVVPFIQSIDNGSADMIVRAE
ncbi:MAG TPA: hypothetical protein VNA04_16415 [Thermoanaerobaculia bacterium]|nr:hypothetical protein [Thermoanaerobaculia bacterium]